MNAADILLLLVLALVFLLALRSVVKRRGRSCGCGCEHCPQAALGHCAGAKMDKK